MRNAIWDAPFWSLMMTPKSSKITMSIVEELGWEPVPAHSGGEALEMLGRRKEIDLLITDIQMPDLGGAPLAREAVRLREGLHVILVSGGEAGPRSHPGPPCG